MDKQQKLIIKGGQTKLYIFKSGQTKKTHFKGWANKIFIFKDGQT